MRDVKNIRMRPEGTGNFEIVLHPETSVGMVRVNSSRNLTEELESAWQMINLSLDRGANNDSRIVGLSNKVNNFNKITLSPNDAKASNMEEGEIWIKYE